MTRLLGWLAGLVAWLWIRTLRVRVEVARELEEGEAASRPWVLALFHGSLFPGLAWPRRRRTAVLVSRSRDGELLAGALEVLGMLAVRGSSSAGGARGLAGILRVLRRRDRDVAFAVDGPRGPARIAKPGAALAAFRGEATLVPMASAVASARVFRSWDGFVLPLPFSRVVVVLGPPVEVAGEGSMGERSLSTHITAAERRAEAILAGWGSPMVRFPSFL